MRVRVRVGVRFRFVELGRQRQMCGAATHRALLSERRRRDGRGLVLQEVAVVSAAQVHLHVVDRLALAQVGVVRRGQDAAPDR